METLSEALPLHMPAPSIDGLGLVLRHKDSAHNTLRWSRAAEQTGLGSVWISEDYFHPGAFSLAGAVAAATTKISVGIGVVNPFTRHPAVLAMESAALADIAPDRFILGLGSSNRNAVEGRMGIPFGKPLTALLECGEIVRGLLKGETVSYQGHSFSLDRIQLESPAGTHIPILLGVKGSKALASAGKVADGVLGAMLTTPAHLRRLRAAVGNSKIVACYVPFSVDSNRQRARGWTRSLIARYLGLLHGQPILEDAGFLAAETQKFRDAMIAGADSIPLVDERMIDTFAVAGTHEECLQKLHLLAEAGADTVIAMVPREADMDEQIVWLGRLSALWKSTRRN